MDGQTGQRSGGVSLSQWRAAKPGLLAKLDVLRPFDPWSSPMCTCPPKLSLDVYSGCGYECVYCYVSAYNPRYWGFERVRPKRDLLRRLQRDIARIFQRPEFELVRRLPVAISNSSDPYPAAPGADEARLGLTRAALQTLAEAGFPLLITTKSGLVVRDLDVLERVPSVVAITITTLDEEKARRLEPRAPGPRERLQALQQAARRVPAVCRIDPIIPGINDAEDELAAIVEACASAGVRHVIASTYKYRPDNFRRIEAIFPREAQRIRDLLDTSRRISGYWYLRREIRLEMLSRLRRLVESAGMSFSVCREGLPELLGPGCDGQHLLRPQPGEPP